MKYLDFYSKLTSLDDKEYVETFLVYNLSLVIAGAKPAVTITIKKNNHRLYDNWDVFGSPFIKELNLNYIQLRECFDAVVIMVYDESILEKHLSSKQTIDFLTNIGYSSNLSTRDYVNKLKYRYEQYHCPHEIGIFLGIPIKDVKDFINCTTKKCLLCKYWKVYNDSNKAQTIFDTYDKIKEHTIKNILTGDSSINLVLSIKNSFNQSAKYI
ncbi:DUF3793 family protein [Clostridium nigeriense]|uniref:DUF3793 family protein n=1 Tax=Clostridium nigeriense TaxID=1805470 RepID=UPI003D3555A4